MQTGIAASSISRIMPLATEPFSLSKPTMKPGGDEHAGGVDLVDRFHQRALGVLLLLHGDEGFGIRALDADEHADEIRLAHRFQEIVVVGQIDRGLGGELEGIILLLQPALQLRHEGAHRLLVADEIVVDKIDMAAITEPVQLVELAAASAHWSWRAARGRKAR